MPTNYINNTKCPSCNSNSVTFDEETSHAKCSVCGMTVHKVFIDAIAQLDNEATLLNEKLTFAISTIANSERRNTIQAKIIAEYIMNHPETENEFDALLRYHTANTPTPTIEIHEKLPTTVIH